MTDEQTVWWDAWRDSYAKTGNSESAKQVADTALADWKVTFCDGE